MSTIVAIVKSLVGQVFAVSLDGLKRQIFEGERLLQNLSGKRILDLLQQVRQRIDRSSLLPKYNTASGFKHRDRMVTSRAAENLYWLGRYTERLEQIVRLSRYVLRCLGEDANLVHQGRLGRGGLGQPVGGPGAGQGGEQQGGGGGQTHQASLRSGARTRD